MNFYRTTCTIAAIFCQSCTMTDDKPILTQPPPEIIEKVVPEEKHLPIDPSLIAAIIHVESNGNPRAVSKCGAKGLMQIMTSNLKRLGVKRPFHPQENIRAGITLLLEELDRFDGDLHLALAAYNAGSPKVLKAIKKAGTRQFSKVSKFLPYQTKRYVPKVLAALMEEHVREQYTHLARRVMLESEFVRLT